MFYFFLSRIRTKSTPIRFRVHKISRWTAGILCFLAQRRIEERVKCCGQMLVAGADGRKMRRLPERRAIMQLRMVDPALATPESVRFVLMRPVFWRSISSMICRISKAVAQASSEKSCIETLTPISVEFAHTVRFKRRSMILSILPTLLQGSRRGFYRIRSRPEDTFTQFALRSPLFRD
jgi:hypothetical protein